MKGNNSRSDAIFRNPIRVEAISKVGDLDPIISESDVIGIDEGQFYPDLADKVESFLRKDKIVIISALDGTFER